MHRIISDIIDGKESGSRITDLEPELIVGSHAENFTSW